MPAVSKSQRRFFGACEHGAGYASCPKGMTKKQMHDFATTPEKGLPERVKKSKISGDNPGHVSSNPAKRPTGMPSIKW